MAPRRHGKIDDEIDRNLRRAFDALAGEPLPDRFAALLERLKAKDAPHEPDQGPDAPKSDGTAAD